MATVSLEAIAFVAFMAALFGLGFGMVAIGMYQSANRGGYRPRMVPRRMVSVARNHRRGL